jgi:hypothetical protein
MDVKPQPGDEVGATPLSANYQDAIEQQIQRGKQDMWKSVTQGAKDWANWRLRQVPTVEEAAAGNVPVMPGTLGRGWTTEGGKQLAKILGPWLNEIEQAPNKLSYSPTFSGPAKELRSLAYGVALPDSVRKTGDVWMQGPGPATIYMNPDLLQRHLNQIGKNIGPQTGAHEAVGHGLQMITKGQLNIEPERAIQDFASEYLKPTSEAHTPEYLTRLIQFYNSQGRGGISHAWADLIGNRQASQGGFAPLDRSIGTSFPILNRPKLNRILEEIKTTGGFKP